MEAPKRTVAKQTALATKNFIQPLIGHGLSGTNPGCGQRARRSGHRAAGNPKSAEAGKPDSAP